MKRIVAFIFMASMVFSLIFSPLGLSSVADAQKLTTDEQIDALFDEMMKLIALSVTTKDASAIGDYQSRISQIDDQLEQLGVDNLNQRELAEFLEEKNVPAARVGVTLPDHTNTVKWYLIKHPNTSYNSKSYDVQKLIAIGNNSGGTLVTGEDNYRFYSNVQKIANQFLTITGIYVQKAIGKIPIVEWTPYELLFSNTPTNIFNSSYVTHRCVSSIIFSYVKESNQGDEDDYTLCFYSNRIEVAVHNHGAAVVDSNPTTYSKQISFTTTADYFNNDTAAIRAFLGEIDRYDYISYYEVKSCDGQYSKKVYVPTPLAGPGQIY